MPTNQQQSKKGRPPSAGKRKHKIAAYYEYTYPMRKMRRIWHDTHRVKPVRVWADNYRSPSGQSATGLFVKLGKELGFNVQEQ